MCAGLAPCVHYTLQSDKGAESLLVFNCYIGQADMIYRSRDALDMTYQDTGVQMDASTPRAPLKSAMTETTESFNLPTIDQSVVAQKHKMAEYPPRPMEPLARENSVRPDVKSQYQQDIGVQVEDARSICYIIVTSCNCRHSNRYEGNLTVVPSGCREGDVRADPQRRFPGRC